MPSVTSFEEDLAAFVGILLEVGLQLTGELGVPGGHGRHSSSPEPREPFVLATGPPDWPGPAVDSARLGTSADPPLSFDDLRRA